MAQRGLSVTDRSNDTPTYEGAMQFTDNADEDVEYEYDQNGNMTNVSIKRGQSKRVCSSEREKGRAKPKDLNANITSIQYNCLNLPSTITAFQYHTYPLPRPHTTRRDYIMHYTYNADGEKIMVSEDPVVSLGLNAAGAPTATTSGGAARATGGVLPGIPEDSLVTGSVIVNPEFDLSTRYCGNVVFERGEIARVLTDEGYITFAPNGKPMRHYYLRDHLGNVRVVFNQTGTVEQRNDYYPYGGLTGESTGGSVQPYKYNGKELERMNGLDLYDYGARWMDAALGRFTTIDPMCEKYYDISPYAYCAGNPVNRIDPDGMKDTIFVQGQDKPVADLPNTETPLFYPDYTINPSAYKFHKFALSYPNGYPTDIEHQEFPRWDEHPENNMGGYTQLDSNEPNVPDDRVIYYVDVNEDGVFQYGEHISHSAIVYSVDNNGYTTAVISKRGELGISINHPRAPGFYNTDNGRPTSRAYFRENQKYLKMKYSNNTRNSFHNNMGIEKRDKTYVAPKPQVKYK